MQTLSNINKNLKTIGIPVAYGHFEDEHAYPYVVYKVTDTDPLVADNKVYADNCSIQIDLYTKMKDIKLENKIKYVLNELEIPYSTSETEVKEENCIAVSFFIEVLIELEEE